MLPEKTPQLRMSQVMLRSKDMNITVRAGSNQETGSSKSDSCYSRPYRCRLKTGVGKTLKMGKVGPLAQALAMKSGNSGAVAYLYI